MLEELPGDRQCVYIINTRQIYYLKLYSMSLIFSVKFLQWIRIVAGSRSGGGSTKIYLQRRIDLATLQYVPQRPPSSIIKLLYTPHCTSNLSILV